MGASKNSMRDTFIIKLRKNVEARCADPEDIAFSRYGGRGIRNELSIGDIELLYERDRPDRMIRPSLDRKDNDGNYTRDNCQFIEMLDNMKKRTFALPKQCTVCGALGATRKHVGRLLCVSCWKSEKLTVIKPPRFVQYAIAAAEANGLICSRVVNDIGVASRAVVSINGVTVKIYVCRTPFRPTPQNKSTYWRFHVSTENPTNFYIFVGRKVNAYRFFIVPKEAVDEHWVYVTTRRSRKNYWTQYENAWHLLAPANDMSTRPAA